MKKKNNTPEAGATPSSDKPVVLEAMTPEKHLETLVKAAYSTVYITTSEDNRVQHLLFDVSQKCGYQLYSFNVVDGLFQIVKNDNGEFVPGATIRDAEGEPVLSPTTFLEKCVTDVPEKSIIYAQDFHLFFESPDADLTARFKRFANVGRGTKKTLVVAGCRLKMQPEIEKELFPMELPLPDRDQLGEVLDNLCVSSSNPILENGERDKIIDAGLGMTTIEMDNACAYAYKAHGAFVASVISDLKSETVKKNGVLEIVKSRITLDDIGGLGELKDWLRKRKDSFSKKAKEYGLPSAKGLLTVGIPGCGKSLFACAVSAAFGDIPLLRLDGGKLFASHVGDSEQNMRIAIQVAEACSPCVLWTDEIEKSFGGSKSSNSTDGGTTARVFGTFIQWMNDKTKPVFVVATANDISQLPPELLRKGRFDELFFVDLPNAEERKEIWAVQIKKHGRFAKNYNLDELSECTDRFTGSEIEQLFIEALYAAFEHDTEPDNALIKELSHKVYPLADTMKEDINKLRVWAEGRARKATASLSNQTTFKSMATTQVRNLSN